MLLSGGYVQYGYRYVIVLLYAIPNISNAMVWITFAPISSQVQDSYSVSSLEVSMCSSSFMIMYVICNFPADYVLDTYGSRPGVYCFCNIRS